MCSDQTVYRRKRMQTILLQRKKKSTLRLLLSVPNRKSSRSKCARELPTSEILSERAHPSVYLRYGLFISSQMDRSTQFYTATVCRMTMLPFEPTTLKVKGPLLRSGQISCLTTRPSFDWMLWILNEVRSNTPSQNYWYLNTQRCKERWTQRILSYQRWYWSQPGVD